jgi:hypothetical protein
MQTGLRWVEQWEEFAPIMPGGIIRKISRNFFTSILKLLSRWYLIFTDNISSIIPTMKISLVMFQENITEQFFPAPVGGPGMFQDPAPVKPHAVRLGIPPQTSLQQIQLSLAYFCSLFV